jgi:hypothetical protein
VLVVVTVVPLIVSVDGIRRKVWPVVALVTITSRILPARSVTIWLIVPI